MNTDYSHLLERIRATFASGRTLDIDWRVAQLRALQRMVVEHEDDIAAAVYADIGKSADEVRLTELSVVTSEIDHIVRNLRRWLAPRRVEVPASLQPASARVVPRPLGVVLTLTPWNYPVQLLLSSMVGAIAAGNAVVAKPSESAPATSAALAKLIPQYVDSELIVVVEGGVEESTRLLEQRFDHIIYTGSGRVGRIVMRAAAEHLTPVTLELGGKSPVFVDDTGDMETIARRLVWAKFTNAGQTCVAPDYVLVTDTAHDALVTALGAAITEAYGKHPEYSPDFGRIINDHHVARLQALLADGTIAHGGQVDASQRYIAPTVLTDVALEAPVMAEEIFGPILPIIRVPDAPAAISIINDRPKPLSLYNFSTDRRVRRLFRNHTSSGSLVEGAALMQMSIHDLPFGGVGASGMGQYHGRVSIDTFSHLRPIVTKPLVPDTLRAVYPPYTAVKRKLMSMLLPMRRRD